MPEERREPAKCCSRRASSAMDDLDQAVSAGSIRYCPVCDGYEATDRRIAVLGSGTDASTKAKFIRSFSRQVTLLQQGAPVAESGGRGSGRFRH